MTDLKHFLEALFSPVGLTTAILVIGLATSLLREGSRAGPRLLYCGVGLYLLFFLSPLAEVIYANLERSFPPMLEPDPGARDVVVLSGWGADLPFLPVTSQLGVETVARMTEGIRLYRRIPNGKLIVSGGILTSGDVPIAQIMARFAMELGVSSQDIVVEGVSTTTYENLVEVRKIVGTRSFILVTSSGVMRRAVAVARKLEMNPLPAPAAVWAAPYFRAGMPFGEWCLTILEHMGYSRNRVAYLQSAFHEYVGYVWYKMLGRI